MTVESAPDPTAVPIPDSKQSSTRCVAPFRRSGVLKRGFVLLNKKKISFVWVLDN